MTLLACPFHVDPPGLIGEPPAQRRRQRSGLIPNEVSSLLAPTQLAIRDNDDQALDRLTLKKRINFLTHPLRPGRLG
jgi:hypothetical protein